MALVLTSGPAAEPVALEEGPKGAAAEEAHLLALGGPGRGEPEVVEAVPAEVAAPSGEEG